MYLNTQMEKTILFTLYVMDMFSRSCFLNTAIKYLKKNVITTKKWVHIFDNYITDSFICPHNAHVSQLELIPGFRACLVNINICPLMFHINICPLMFHSVQLNFRNISIDLKLK